MKRVYSVEDFIKYNHKDLLNIILSKFSNCIKYDYSLEEMTQDFYCHMVRNKVVEKFDPERKVLFSTYIYTCLRNFCFSFILTKSLKKTDHYFNTVSVESDIGDGLLGILGEEDVTPKHDLEVMLSKIKKYERNRSWPSNLSLSELVRLYYLGYSDTAVARMYNVTNACIGAKKKVIREVLLSSVEGREFCKSFKQVSQHGDFK
jgi:hypothetical protein